MSLDSKGRHKMRSGAEEHLYNPQTIHLLQESTRRGDYNLFKQYSKLLDGEKRALNIRGLMDFNYPKKGIPIEEAWNPLSQDLKQVRCPTAPFHRRHMRRLPLQ